MLDIGEGGLAPLRRFLVGKVGDDDGVDGNVILGVEGFCVSLDLCALLVTEEAIRISDVAARRERLGRERGRATDQHHCGHDGRDAQALNPWHVILLGEWRTDQDTPSWSTASPITCILRHDLVV